MAGGDGEESERGGIQRRVRNGSLLTDFTTLCKPLIGVSLDSSCYNGNGKPHQGVSEALKCSNISEAFSKSKAWLQM